MANQSLTRQEITRSCLMYLKNDLRVIPNFKRDLSQEFGKTGAKIGDTIQQRKPARFLGTDGAAYNPEGLIDTAVPITINQQSGVHFEYSTAEEYLSLDEMEDRYLKPAGMALANKLDLRGAQMAVQNTANMVGTPGTTPGLSGTDAFLIYAQAGQNLGEEGFPLKGGGHTIVLTEAARVGWLDFAKAFFNPTSAISKQWDEGQISNALGYKWFIDENMPTQTIGLLGGTPAVNGANQTGTSIITNGWSNSINGILNVGDPISFAGVYRVNPQSRQQTQTLRNFTIQAIANSDGGGAATLSIFPALVPSGPFQNVSNSPSATALINVYNTAAAGQSALSGLATRQMLLWHKDAFAFVSFPGDVPRNADMAYEARSKEVGVSIRFVRMFDEVRDMWPTRIECYYGMGPLYSEGGCRIAA